MSDEPQTPVSGNGRQLRIELELQYLRRDLNQWRDEIGREILRLQTDLDRRIDRLDSIISKVTWAIALAVIGAVLKAVGLV